jgi:hypothetical protein
MIHHLWRFGWFLLALQLSVAQATMLGPEAAIPRPASQADLDRAKVKQFLDQATVKDKLQAMGVSGLQASARVDALSEEEVHALAQRIDSLPAGGRLSDTDIIFILLIIILVILLV